MIYFMRHGETEWSLSGQHTGHTDLPLTPHGEEAARKLKPRLAGIEFSHVLVSPRLRAQQTCELAGLRAEAEIEPDLAEWDYGDYEGKLSADIRKKRPDWMVLREGCPNGEMPAQVSTRADRLIARLHALTGNIGLFSHGQFGCVLATRWIGLPIIQAQHFRLDTASVSILDYGSAPHKPSLIALWNAVS